MNIGAGEGVQLRMMVSAGVNLCKPFGIIVEPWGEGTLLESNGAKTDHFGIDPARFPGASHARCR